MLHGTVPVGVSEWREVQRVRGGRSVCGRAIAGRGTGLWEGRQRGHGTMRLPVAMSMRCVCSVRVVRMVALLLLVGWSEAAGGCLKGQGARGRDYRGMAPLDQETEVEGAVFAGLRGCGRASHARSRSAEPMRMAYSSCEGITSPAALPRVSDGLIRAKSLAHRRALLDRAKRPESPSILEYARSRHRGHPRHSRSGARW